MAEKVVMPKLGATMEEGTIDQWLVSVGDKVDEGDPIVEVQTDKITIEVEAEAAGVLLKKLYDVGETVPVLKTIAYIGEAGEVIEHIEETADDLKAAEDEQKTAIETDAKQIIKSVDEQDKVRRTPIARRLAVENNIDLKDILGTGPKGRVQKIDVERYLEREKTKITPLAKKIAVDKNVDVESVKGSGFGGKILKSDVLESYRQETQGVAEQERVAFRGLRKIIADRMSESFYSAPHVTLYSDVDMMEIIKLRKQLLPMVEAVSGNRLSFNDILIKATAVCLMKHPNINISLNGEEEIVFHKEINMGFAVAIPDGLVVPVIKRANEKGFASITQETKQLVEQARNGTLLPDDMQGSTFTISNLGMYAVDGFTPIINQPNSAILGIGQIKEQPVVVSDEIKIRPMMTLSLSFDHRIIDGAPAAEFLTDLKNILESPYQLLL